MQGIPNGEIGDLQFEGLGYSIRQTRDFKGSSRLLENATLGRTNGSPGQCYRHFNGYLLVHGNGIQIHVQNVLLNWIRLNFFNHCPMALGRLTILDIQIYENILTRPSVYEFFQIPRLQSQRYGIDLGTIEYCWCQGLTPQGAGHTLAGFCS